MEGNEEHKQSAGSAAKEQIKAAAKQAIKQGVKKLWAILPFYVKLIIFGVIALIVILITVICALGVSQEYGIEYGDAVTNTTINQSGTTMATTTPPDVQLAATRSRLAVSYSREISKSNLGTAYEQYWGNFCEVGERSCSDKQIQADKEMEDSQLAFFTKLDTLAKKYSLTDEQRYTVLVTIFFNHNVNEFTSSNGAYNLDNSEDIDYDVNKSYDTTNNAYIRELDTIKELIKQYKVSAAYCRYQIATEGGNTENKEYALSNLNGETYILNFFDEVLIKFGKNPFDEQFDIAKNICKDSYGGEVIVEKTTNNDVSIEAYYNYLRNTSYLDDRESLRSFYTNYAYNHKLSYDINTWTETDKKAVREKIISYIEGIVNDYLEKRELSMEVIQSTEYWFPIGSKETTVNNGIIFASGAPEFINITSPYGPRIHPTTGQNSFHTGVDLGGGYNVNIIASINGTVVRVYNECDSYNSPSCGGGYGNYIEIVDVKGNSLFYAHMFKDSFTVGIGDSVVQGQKIGEMGNSGRSTGPHLHFEIKVNGNTVNPMDYISIKTPRPASSPDFNFNSTTYSKEEFIAVLNKYYSGDVCTSDSTQFVNGCNSFKNEILKNNGAEKIYNIASKRNLNPELIVIRSYVEGYSPGTNYNYFGYACTNTGGLAACRTFTSFSAAAEEFFKNISQYDSLEAMMSRYAYLGDYWYTGVNWGLGGCAYAKYIYPDAIPDRVQKACAHEDDYCTKEDTSRCVETIEADHKAYARWQVSKMNTVRQKIFG